MRSVKGAGLALSLLMSPAAAQTHVIEGDALACVEGELYMRVWRLAQSGDQHGLAVGREYIAQGVCVVLRNGTAVELLTIPVEHGLLQAVRVAGAPRPLWTDRARLKKRASGD